MDAPLSEVEMPGFPLGLDTTSLDGKLGPGGLRKLLGMRLLDEGGLRHAGDFREIVPVTYHVIAFLRWSYGTADRLLFVTSDVAGRNLVYVWNETTGLLDRTITVSAAPESITIKSARFVQAGLSGEVFLLLERLDSDTGDLVTIGESTLFQIPDPLTTVAAIDISAVVAGSAGFPASQVVSGTPNGAGNLDSTGLSRYQWSVALVDSTGRQSQVSLPSVPTEFVNEKAKISFGINAVIAAAVTAGTVTHADLYRIGGTAAQLRFVKRYALSVVAGTIGDSVTGLEIEDNTSEEELSFIVAPTYNDPAPTGLTDIILHQSKLFGIKGTGVYFSRTNDFLYWGYDDNGVDEDGGVIYPDNNTGDAFNGFTSEGSLLILGREQTVYALYGSSLSGGGGQGFAFDQRSNLGNVSRLSLCRSDNEAFYVGRDDLLHSLQDASSPSVSGRIEKTLRSLPETDMAGCVTAHHDGEVYLSIPAADYCFAYDTRRNTWRECTDYRLLARYLAPYPSPSTGELELLSAPVTGGIFACETYSTGGGTQRDVDLITDSLFFPPGRRGRLVQVLIEGEYTGSLVCTLSADSTEKTYALSTTSDRMLYYIALPPDLVGRSIKVRIWGTMIDGEIRRIVLGTLDLRRDS